MAKTTQDGAAAPMEQSAVRRTLTAAFGGNALDNFDFTLFTFLIPTLAMTWGMSRPQAGLIGTATLITGAIGGALAGWLADRFGRVRVLQGTILWFSVFTFLCGFSQNPTQLLWLRAAQGLGFGGELAVGAVLIAEAVAPAARGRIMALVASGYAAGALGAVAVFTGLFAMLPKENAWRAVFWVGILPALLVLYVRRSVVEAPTYARVAGTGSLKPLLQDGMPWRVFLGTALVAGLTGAQNLFVFWLPTYLQTERHMSLGNSSLNYIANTLGALVGFLIGGLIIDKLGRRFTFMALAVAAAAAIATYMYLPLGAGMLMPVGVTVGILITAAGVGMTPILTELFPTEARGAGTGFCYSFGRGLGGLLPLIVGSLSAHAALGPTLAGLVAAAYAVVVLAALLLPETRAKVL